MSETATLYFTSHVTGSVSDPNNALGAPDGVFTTDGNDNISWTSEWQFGTVTGDAVPRTTQTVTLRVRKGSNSGNPEVTSIRVRQGSAYATFNLLGSSVTVSSTTGADIVVTFDGSVLTAVTGTSLEVVTSAAGGAPTARNSVEVDAATWDAAYVVPVLHVGATALSGSGSLAADGIARPTAETSLAGAGLVEAAAIFTSFAPRDTEASETRTTEDGVTRFTTQLIEVTSGGNTFAGDAVLSGSGALEAAGARFAAGNGSFGGVSVLSAAAIRNLLAAAAVAGAGSLAAAGTVDRPAGADLSGAGGIAAGTVIVTAVGQAELNGVGSIVAAAVVDRPAATTLAAAGSLTADGSTAAVVDGAAALAGAGSTSYSATLVYTGHATLEASGSKLSASAIQRFGFSGMEATSSMAAEGVIAMFASASMTGTGSLAATGISGALQRNAFTKRPSDGEWVPADISINKPSLRQTESGAIRVDETALARLLEGSPWRPVRRAWAYEAGEWRQFYGVNL